MLKKGRAVISTIDKMSSIMRYLTWIIALIMLTMFFSNWLEKQRNPNQYLMTSHTNAEPVILNRNRQGHYVATGMINQQPVVFLLDTGATVLSIPENIANKLKLEAGASTRVSTANGSISVHRTNLEQVQLGNIVLKNVEAHINPYMDGDTVLLGMSFLKYLELRQLGNTLTLSVPTQTHIDTQL
jgi:aspartyl protease family protein